MVLPRWLSKLREFERKIGIVELFSENRDHFGNYIGPFWERVLFAVIGIGVTWLCLRFMCSSYQGCQDATYYYYP